MLCWTVTIFRHTDISHHLSLLLSAHCPGSRALERILSSTQVDWSVMKRQPLTWRAVAMMRASIGCCSMRISEAPTRREANYRNSRLGSSAKTDAVRLIEGEDEGVDINCQSESSDLIKSLSQNDEKL